MRSTSILGAVLALSLAEAASGNHDDFIRVKEPEPEEPLELDTTPRPRARTYEKVAREYHIPTESDRGAIAAAQAKRERRALKRKS